MRKLSFRTVALAAALIVAGVLPVAASGLAGQEIYGRAVAVTPEIASFFQERGVDPQYLDMEQTAVPAEQWQKIVRIVNTGDLTGDFTGDHAALNGLVGTVLWASTAAASDPVYMTLGNRTWIYEIAE